MPRQMTWFGEDRDVEWFQFPEKEPNQKEGATISSVTEPTQVLEAILSHRQSPFPRNCTRTTEFIIEDIATSIVFQKSTETDHAGDCGSIGGYQMRTKLAYRERCGSLFERRAG
jgi:hypothetical protein